MFKFKWAINVTRDACQHTRTHWEMNWSAQLKIIVLNCCQILYSELEECQRRSRAKGQMVSGIWVSVNFAELSNFFDRKISINTSVCFSNSRRVFYFFIISGCLFSKVNYKQVIWNIGYFFLVITGASCQWLWCGRSRKVMDINKVVQFTIKDSSSNHNQIIIRSR